MNYRSKRLHVNSYCQSFSEKLQKLKEEIMEIESTMYRASSSEAAGESAANRLGFDPANVKKLSFKELLKRVGPGLILTGIVIGPGNITTSAMLGPTMATPWCGSLSVGGSHNSALYRHLFPLDAAPIIQLTRHRKSLFMVKWIPTGRTRKYHPHWTMIFTQHPVRTIPVYRTSEIQRIRKWKFPRTI